MHIFDMNRVVFYSKEDMAGPSQLQKGEQILRSETKSEYNDINEILELYNIKKYIDNDLYLRNWTEDDIVIFKNKVVEYGKSIGQFMSTISNHNILDIYKIVLHGYVSSFWEIVNNYTIFKQISKSNFTTILTEEPNIIHEILTHKKIVDYYKSEIKTHLLSYPKSAELLLSVYEIQDDFRKKQKYIPQSLTLEDKENILLNYLESDDANLNYISLIQNIRNRSDFKVSDRTRLKAKRLHSIKTEAFFKKSDTVKYGIGVSVSFLENTTKIKDGHIGEDFNIHYSYSLDFIKQNDNPYLLYKNFHLLFEYIDNQKRISLTSKKSELGVFERIFGVHSHNEYRGGTTFSISEMTSMAQILVYNKVLNELNIYLENIIHFVLTIGFQEKYNYANNARFAIPSNTNSYFEKVRLLAPEFESILKQYRLYVEDGVIDFELLQISSSPTSIKDIPSLNPNKYIYFNKDNNEITSCLNLFFSDQTLLAFVEPFKEKKYHNFFELLANEEIKFDSYEEHQKPELNYLLDKGYILIDSNGFVQITNHERVLILKDLYDNEFASFYNYPTDFQNEALQMSSEGIIIFESSLFARPEQAYFNYYLNKSEFTNGLDLRNSYLHGTQANPEDTQKHEYAYFAYLKLLFLTLLKIEDDLAIAKEREANTNQL